MQLKISKKNIFDFLWSIIGFILIIVKIEDYIPNAYTYLGCLVIISMAYHLFKAKKYLNNKPANEIRIKSINDGYHQLSMLIFGSIACLFPVLFYFAIAIDIKIALFFFIIGLLTMYGSKYQIPSVLIKFEKNNLFFENDKIKEDFKIHNIKSFQIEKEQIRFIMEEGEDFLLQYLELDVNEAALTEKFLKKYIY
jgi:hypothetical protein